MKKNTAGLLIAISVYAFALGFLWNTLNPLVIPYLVNKLVPELKNTYLGLITAVGLVLAMVVQPLAGGLSDRSRSRWGRRRPYIVAGTLGDLVFLAIMALAGNFWVLFGGYCLLQFSANIAHGPYQGFIPDLVPEDKKGLASGIKGLVELVGVVIGSAIIGSLLGRDQPALAIGLMGAVLLVSMLITAVAVREKAPVEDASSSAVPPLTISSMIAALRSHRVFAWFILSRFLILAGLAAVRTFAQNYLQDVLKAPNPAAQTGQLMTILGLAVLLVILPAGFLADKVGRKRINLFSVLLGAVGTTLMLTVGTYNELVIYGAIVGIAVGIFYSANWALAMDLIPATEAALFLGLTNLATAGSGAVAGAFGPMIDVVNRTSPGLGYRIVFALAAILWLLGGVIILRFIRSDTVPHR